jgi:putative transposase
VILEVSLASHERGDHPATPVAHEEFDPYQLLDALRAGGDVDRIRQSVEYVLQALIELEATEAIGAAPHQRSESRTN